jgi:hypothetical protein
MPIIINLAELRSPLSHGRVATCRVGRTYFYGDGPDTELKGAPAGLNLSR